MIEVCIPSYGRAPLLGRLLDDLEREAGAWSGPVRVTVYDDASPEGYEQIAERLAGIGWLYVRADRRHGRAGFRGWTHRIYAAQRHREADAWIFLADDMRLCDGLFGRGFFARAVGAWRGIHDERKAALTIHRDAARIAMPCWTGVRPLPVGDVELTQWVDGAFVCGREYFEALGWGCPVPPERLARDPLAGSGVGAAISGALVQAGRTLYRTRQSLVVHAISPTALHEDLHGRVVRMETVDFCDGPDACAALQRIDRVDAGMATIAARREALPRVVASILPQVDSLTVYLDDYDDPPECLRDQRVRVVTQADAGRRLGDAGKFCGLVAATGYYLSLDDDLIYPPDYVSLLLHHIEARRRLAVVAAHGRLVDDELAGGYYAARPIYRCLHAVTEDAAVHVPGTGVTAFHRSTLPELSLADFEQPNMADVWLGLACHRAGVPCVVARHAKGWIEHIDTGATIHSTSRGGEGEALMTAAIRTGAPWGEPLPDPLTSEWRREHDDLAHMTPAARRSLVRLPSRTAPVVPRRVSVLIPAWRAERWLALAVESVLAQELPAGWTVDVWIGVDGCPGTRAVAAALAGPRVTVLASEHNCGPYAVLNRLAYDSAGELITALGADDMMAQGRLVALLDAMADPAVLRASTGYAAIDEGGATISEHVRSPDGVWLWRRSAWEQHIGGYRPWRCGADSEAHERAMRLRLRGARVGASLYLRREHDGQLTQSEDAGLRSALRAGYVRMLDEQRARYGAGEVPAPVAPLGSSVVRV